LVDSQSARAGDGAEEDLFTDSSRAVSSGVTLLVVMVVAAAGAAALLPFLFRLVPNDFSRIATVLNALPEAPPVVIFGDSRAEAAVDARRLSNGLPGRPVAWNLSWHAQRFDHAALLYSQLDRKPRTVLQFVTLQDLASDDPSEPRVGEAMRQYGFEPREADVAMMRAAFGARTPSWLTESRLTIALHARWGVRQLPDVVLRQMIRRDLALEHERRDLYFPSPYTRRLGAAEFARLFAVVNTQLPQAAISGSRASLTTSLARDQRMILILPPGHSRTILPDHDRRVDDLRRFGASIGVGVLDASRWIPDDQFIDPLHVSTSGARIFTDRLALEMKGGR
jgi:hypothetical protein